MSYILDALQRADAERDRGRVPSLSTPTGLPAGASSAPLTHRAAMSWRVWAVVTGLLACAAALGWWWFSPGAAPAAPPAAVEPEVRAFAPAPAPAPMAAPLPAPSTVPAAPILAPAEPARSATASPGNTAAATPAEKPAVVPSAQTASAPAPVPATPPTTPSSQAPQPVRRWADLPADTRAQLPTVSVNGSTWSQNPAHRMLIANGQVLQEGQSLSPGLVLERIDKNSAVLNHRGLRYSISY